MSKGFFDDIETVGEISSGGYAKVYEICKGKYDKDTKSCDGNLYAEKVYTQGEPEFNEIDILSRFDHPNLLKSVKSHLDTNGNFHLVLPLADKPNYDLKTVIEKGKLPFDKAIFYIYQVISAVGFLHSQEYYHCDIKPGNILMFDGNCVLADYGFTYPTIFDTETYCGTMGYASPQGFQEGREIKDWPYYREKLSQIQGDIYAIGSTFFECLTGEHMVNYLEYNTSEDKTKFRNNNAYTEFTHYVFDKSYRKVESRILYMRDNAETEAHKLAFDCIYNMCRNSQKDRYKTIDDILQHPLFVSRTMTRIIPGKVKATKMPTINVCKSTIRPKMTVENMMKDVSDDTWLSTALRKNKYTLLTFITWYTLLYRTIYLAKNTDDIALILASCLYLSIAVFQPANISYKQLFIATNEEHKPGVIRNMVYKIVDELDGVIRIPSIYEETDNALEIVWWLLNVSKECNYLIKSPKELHSMYAEIEANNRSLISSRINKNEVLSVYLMFSRDEYYYVITYGDDETVKVSIDTDGEPILHY